MAARFGEAPGGSPYDSRRRLGQEEQRRGIHQGVLVVRSSLPRRGLFRECTYVPALSIVEVALGLGKPRLKTRNSRAVGEVVHRRGGLAGALGVVPRERVERIVTNPTVDQQRDQIRRHRQDPCTARRPSHGLTDPVDDLWYQLRQASASSAAPPVQQTRVQQLRERIIWVPRDSSPRQPEGVLQVTGNGCRLRSPQTPDLQRATQSKTRRHPRQTSAGYPIASSVSLARESGSAPAAASPATSALAPAQSRASRRRGFHSVLSGMKSLGTESGSVSVAGRSTALTRVARSEGQGV